MTIDGLLKRLRRRIRRAGSQRAWAKEHRIDESVLSDVLNGRRDPSDRLCKALGVRRRLNFVPETTE